MLDVDLGNGQSQKDDTHPSLHDRYPTLAHFSWYLLSFLIMAIASLFA
jgi:hypothetical protein